MFDVLFWFIFCFYFSVANGDMVSNVNYHTPKAPPMHNLKPDNRYMYALPISYWLTFKACLTA